MTESNPAQTTLSVLRDMLAAVAIDYDRLEELRETGADELTTEDAAELAELEAAAGDCADEDDARQRIQEDPLSVQVRSGWYAPGEESPAPEEFEVLLSTGGPAVRIIGEPSRAWIEWQDWGTPWAAHYEPGMGDVCLEYARHFYFGS